MTLENNIFFQINHSGLFYKGEESSLVDFIAKAVAISLANSCNP